MFFKNIKRASEPNESTKIKDNLIEWSYYKILKIKGRKKYI